MLPRPTRTVLALAVVHLFVATAPATQPEKPGGTATQTARAVLAMFDKGDPGWKVRMEGLVRLAKAGPGVTPALAEGLKSDFTLTREFAAQALVLFPDVKAKPALEKAVEDPQPGVRIFAIQALSMFGPLPRTERHEKILASDPNHWGVRPMMASALVRDDKPDAAALRKALAGYDLRTLDSARVGEMAPDFTLTDFTGKTYRLSQFRGKKAVVLRFILFDF